jgi:DNA-binding transcriptional MerR regulator
MSNRIITLFGEEIEPEQLKSAAKPRAKKGVAREEESLSSESPKDEAPEATAEALVPPVAAPKTPAEKPITLPEEWSGEKQYYAIGEVAELFKVKTSHIRFWTNEFKIKVRTTRKGDRLYSPDQIKELRAIHHLVKERGFTLTGAKAKLKAQNKMDVETVDLKQSLLQLRNKLVVIRNQIV